MAFKENVVLDEGVSRQGVHTHLHFQDSELLVQRAYDADPHLEYAKRAREATEGQRWGDGKLIGHIPPAQYAQFLKIRDNQERRKAIMTWLRENPAFCMFDKALR